MTKKTNVLELPTTGRAPVTRETFEAILERLRSVQSHVTVCLLALRQKSVDDDHHVAHLLSEAREQLAIATDALSGNEAAQRQVMS